MHEIAYLRDIVVLFGAALGVLVISSRLRIPSIVGFLVTGMLVGPHGLGWITDPVRVEQFAVFGVVFLLFVIGLELSTERLRRLWRTMGIGGTVQAGGTLAVVMIIAYAFGHPAPRAFFLGAVVALSSTAVVLKIYQDRRELDSPHGQVSLGILLYQDFLVVPLLLLVPLLAGAADTSVSSLLLRFGLGVVVMGLVFLVSRYLLPYFLHAIVRTQIRELFVIGSLSACLAAAWATEALGFSLALGAFLAGILIGESEYHAQVAAEMMPFRDVFNSMFFISIGMLLRLDYVMDHAILIVVVGLSIVALKISTAFVAATVLRFPLRTALLTAFGLAQTGEFSFVLVQAGLSTSLIDDALYQLAIASAVLTILLTPLLVSIAPRVAFVLHSLRTGAGLLPPPAPEASSLSGHVVIAGFGLGGRNLARVLRSARIPYVITEVNGVTAREARRAGEPMIYGDVSRRSILEQCRADTAQALVFLVSDDRATRRAVRVARELNPHVFIIARARQLADIEELQRDGADEVIAQEFESSIEIVTRVLERRHIPRNVITTQEHLLRADGYQMLRAPSTPRGISESVARALAAGTTDTFLIIEDQSAVGRTIGEIDLRRATGATIIAVVRDEDPFTNPPPDFRFAAGDVLVLVGDHAEIERAFGFLERTKAEGSELG